MPTHPIPKRTVLASPLHLLAFGFGTGLSPIAPGTTGTLLGVLLFLLIADAPLPVYSLLVATLFAVGIAICGRSARRLGVHDHSGIVLDEIVGYLVAMLSVPKALLWIIVGLIVFRLFDIVKPWPIHIVDRRLEGGTGIMLDDVLAGLYTLIVLHLLMFLIGFSA